MLKFQNMIEKKFEQTSQEKRIDKWRKEITTDNGTEEYLESILEQKPTLEEIRELMEIFEPLLLKNEQKEKIADIIMTQEPDNEDLSWIIEFVKGPFQEKAVKTLLEKEPSIKHLWRIYWQIENLETRKIALLQLKEREGELNNYEKEALHEQLACF